MITTTHATPPTARQQAVLDFIVKAMRTHGRPPSIREMCIEFGWTSPNGPRIHLLSLVRKGKLRRESGTSRCYIPVGLAGCCSTCGRPLDE